ncbi:MAG: hypothetical protein ACRDBF_09075 [Plesiomonas shigelloides]
MFAFGGRGTGAFCPDRRQKTEDRRQKTEDRRRARLRWKERRQPKYSTLAAAWRESIGDE